MKPLIAICIATYHRPRLLQQTLMSLPQHVPEPYRAEIRVVDNDGARSAEPVVKTFAAQSRIPTRYLVEPKQNIALARNCAINAGPANYLLFIDDDEVASPSWLLHLIQAMRQTRADVVIGPVVGLLPSRSPAWCKQGGWFDKPVPGENGRMHWTGTRTSNTLVRGQWFFEQGLRFNESYGCSGGSDVALFKVIAGRGGIFHAASQAVVYEAIPAERATLRWLMKRHYRGGLIYQRVSGGLFRKPLVDAFRRMVKMVAYGVLGLFSVCMGRRGGLVRAMTQSALFAGGLAAFLRPCHGAAYVEYKSRVQEFTA